MSERRQLTAVRIANVPEDIFEEAVAAEKPATITQPAKAELVERSPVGCCRACHQPIYESFSEHVWKNADCSRDYFRVEMRGTGAE